MTAGPLCSCQPWSLPKPLLQLLRGKSSPVLVCSKPSISLDGFADKQAVLNPNLVPKHIPEEVASSVVGGLNLVSYLVVGTPFIVAMQEQKAVGSQINQSFRDMRPQGQDKSRPWPFLGCPQG